MFLFDLDCTWLLAVLCVLFVRRNLKRLLLFEHVHTLFQPVIVASAKLLFADVAFGFNLSVLHRLKTPHISDWCHAVRVRQCTRLDVTSCVSSWPAPSHLIALCVSSHPFVLHDRVTYVLISV